MDENFVVGPWVFVVPVSLVHGLTDRSTHLTTQFFAFRSRPIPASNPCAPPPPTASRMLRKPRPSAIRDTVAALIGLLVRHATYIAPGAGRAPVRGGSAKADDRTRAEAEAAEAAGGGLMSALIATAGERSAGPGRAAQAAAALRRNAVAALGELLFYIVTQEPVGTGGGGGGGGGCPAEGGGVDTERWSIPVAAVASVVGRCLLVVDDAGGGRLTGHEGARHYAAKTMENVLAQVGPSHPLVPALVTPELALGLLDVAR